MKYKIIGFVIIGAGLFLFYLTSTLPPKNIIYGVNFSKFHSEELELNYRAVFTALLDEMKVRKFRITAHWPEIEPKDDVYNFSALDWQVREAQKRDADIILALGMRLPGWPECHIPDWAVSLSDKEREEKVKDMLEDVVNHFKEYENIVAWQIENEYFLSVFGFCPELRKEFLDEEIALVKSLDSRPILITDSGEFGSWYKAYPRGDFFGTTLYRIVNNDVIGFFKYPLPPEFFIVKRRLMELLFEKKDTIVIELQSEPWSLEPLVDTPLDVQYKRFSFKEFQNIVPYTKRAGFDTMYFWGAEWWYWLKKNHNDSRYWDWARQHFSID